jgi:hypothetical protein
MQLCDVPLLCQECERDSSFVWPGETLGDDITFSATDNQDSPHLQRFIFKITKIWRQNIR